MVDRPPDARPPDLIIFDCDGTLIDSEIVYSRVEAQVLTRLGYAITPEEMLRRFCGITAADMFAALERDFAMTLPDDFDDMLRAATDAAFESDLSSIPHVEEVLETLETPACVASNSDPDRLRSSLSHAGLYQRFAPNVFSAASVERGKPAPDLFLFACDSMGADPRRALVVEDTVPGVTAARRAGIPVVGFSGGSHCQPGHADTLRDAGALAVFDDMRAVAAFAKGAG